MKMDEKWEELKILIENINADRFAKEEALMKLEELMEEAKEFSHLVADAMEMFSERLKRIEVELEKLKGEKDVKPNFYL